MERLETDSSVGLTPRPALSVVELKSKDAFDGKEEVCIVDDCKW